MLRKKAATALAWSGADVLIRQSLGFLVTVLLARLLSPSDFGMMAMLSLFLGLAGVFSNGGFAQALIRERERSPKDESTVFWLNCILGLAVALILVAIAPLIASFYGLPTLTKLIYFGAAGVFVSAFGSIHSALLTSALRFDAILKIGLLATLVSGITAVWLAWMGFGVWSLAVQSLLHNAVTTLGYWIVSPWRPLGGVHGDSARRLFRFGGYAMAASLLDTLYGRLYTALIGRMYGSADLGFFSRAEGTQQFPVGVVTGVVTRVSFPVFAEAATDPARLRRGMRLALQGIMAINIPAMLGLAAIADPLVLLVFGAKWQPSVPILQVLCLSGVLWPIHVLNLNVLMAQGHSRLFFRLEVVKKVVGTCFMLVGSQFGVLGLAWSIVAVGAVGGFVNTWYSRRFLQYGLRAQVADIRPFVIASAPMVVVVFLLVNGLNAGSGAKVAAAVLVGALTYAATGFGLRSTSWGEAMSIFRGFLVGRV